MKPLHFVGFFCFFFFFFNILDWSFEKGGWEDHRAAGVFVSGAGMETQLLRLAQEIRTTSCLYHSISLIALPTHLLSLMVLVTPYLWVMMFDLIVLARHLEFPE